MLEARTSGVGDPPDTKQPWDDARDVLVDPERMPLDEWSATPLRCVQGREPLGRDCRKIMSAGTFETVPSFYKIALEFADLTPSLDVFATSMNAKCPQYFTIEDVKEAELDVVKDERMKE